MTQKNYSNQTTYRIVFAGLFAALIYVGTIIRIPLGESKVHMANALSVLAGLMLSPVDAGLSSGLGSAIYDLTMGGYGALDAAITFVSKFIMAFLAAILKRLFEKHTKNGLELKHTPQVYVISAISAFTYVALYMLKTFVKGLTVDGLNMSGTLVKMGAKLPASAINAAFATAVAPILFWALWTPLKKMGLISRINPSLK